MDTVFGRKWPDVSKGAMGEGKGGMREGITVEGWDE